MESPDFVLCDTVNQKYKGSQWPCGDTARPACLSLTSTLSTHFTLRFHILAIFHLFNLDMVAQTRRQARQERIHAQADKARAKQEAEKAPLSAVNTDDGGKQDADSSHETKKQPAQASTSSRYPGPRWKRYDDSAADWDIKQLAALQELMRTVAADTTQSASASGSSAPSQQSGP